MQNEIVAEARSWLGTPWHHGADIRGAGVDCGMLLVRVFVDLGAVPRFDPRPYTNDWFLHRDAELFLDWIETFCSLIESHADAAIGDILVFRHGRCFAHGAIVTDLAPLTILHAFSPQRVVVEARLDRVPVLAARERRLYRIVAA